MQTRNKKQKTSKRGRASLHLLMCGVLLSTTLLPIPVALAETITPTTDSSTPVPTLDSSGTDLTTDESKAPESQAPTVPSTDSTTEDITESTQETPVEEPETNNSEPTTASTVHSDEAQPTQNTQRVPQLRSIIPDTWGTSPVSFDDSTGVLTVSAGTIASYTYGQSEIGSIEKSKITKIIFKDGVYAPVNSAYLFNGEWYPNLEMIEGKLDTSNVTNMSNMFGNSQITSLNVSNWDTSNVTNMSNMFLMSRVTSLDVSNWNTSNVTNMSYMFGDSQVTSLDVSNWDTSNVTYMSYMFGNSQVTSLDVSNWDTSNVTYMTFMFVGTPLKEIKLGEKSRFKSNVNLSSINTASGEYTGKWERIDPKTPISEYDNSNDFMDQYDGTLPGTYVWQKVQAKDLTVFYQDTDGNKLAESKTVSGNVGDTFNETPITIEGYTFKEVKDNAPTEGTLSDKEQSITFIYTKNPVKAKDLTVSYQDTDGNEISKSKTVSGNVGDEFNETPITIEGYTFKEVKDNAPTEGTLSDKEQSITFIYTKKSTEPTKPTEPTEPSKDKNENATAIGTSENRNNNQAKSLPKTGEEVSSTITFAGITALLLASCVWLVKRRQNKKQ